MVSEPDPARILPPDRSVSQRVDRLVRVYDGARRADYIGEGVSQLEHALQAAELAREANAPATEVLAALLHDVGHLCAPDADRMRRGAHVLGAEWHEEIGADFLAALGFGDDVTELVRGHVAAKRYLVAARPGYADRLSRASVGTLALQGGPMDARERAAFEASSRCDATLRVRAWDEAAKQPGRVVPRFDAYLLLVARHLEARLEASTRPNVTNR